MDYVLAFIFAFCLYAIVIRVVNSGRCFRNEYIIKTLGIYGCYILAFIVIYIHFFKFSLPYFIFLVLFGLIALSFLSLKFTIQRFYDLDMSGWNVLFKAIPIFGIFVSLYLFFKKGNDGINIYDKAIDYRLFFKNKLVIDIYNNKFIINNEEFQYEKYLKNYIIKIPNHVKGNVFTQFLLKTFSTTQTQPWKIIEVPIDEFFSAIKNQNLIVVNYSFYLHVKSFKLFIRKENFNYTFVLDKVDNEISKEMFAAFDFPGAFFEDDKFIYYRGIDKEDLFRWAESL